ncbi:hypothetical protein EJ02DRAFT_421581 [Clathrospora elynae]|uniref:Uncharacterized protein n=1 Tax=Clathrospora elynae TaxID=706981 RepID=A0A6A5STX2_9PLEO|nr:hypothetical protein EJ02DRAFT_421581 [Clathrospora elynae]
MSNPSQSLVSSPLPLRAYVLSRSSTQQQPSEHSDGPIITASSPSALHVTTTYELALTLLQQHKSAITDMRNNYAVCIPRYLSLSITNSKITGCDITLVLKYDNAPKTIVRLRIQEVGIDGEDVRLRDSIDRILKMQRRYSEPWVAREEMI